MHFVSFPIGMYNYNEGNLLDLKGKNRFLLDFIKKKILLLKQQNCACLVNV